MAGVTGHVTVKVSAGAQPGALTATVGFEDESGAKVWESDPVDLSAGLELLYGPVSAEASLTAELTIEYPEGAKARPPEEPAKPAQPAPRPPQPGLRRRPGVV